MTSRKMNDRENERSDFEFSVDYPCSLFQVSEVLILEE